MLTMTIASLVREARRRAGLTQAQLAEREKDRLALPRLRRLRDRLRKSD